MLAVAALTGAPFCATGLANLSGLVTGLGDAAFGDGAFGVEPNCLAAGRAAKAGLARIGIFCAVGW